MTDRFLANTENIVINQANKIYRIRAKTVEHLEGNNWKVVKVCATYQEAILLLKQLQGG